MLASLRFFPERASTIAGQVDAVFLFTLAVAVFFIALISAVIIFFMIRYKRRREDSIGKPTREYAVLELTWTIVPLVILLFIFAWGAKVFFAASRPPSNAVEYYCTGKRWMWKFQHPEGNREINTLHVPVNTPIKVSITSEDVIHSFFVPAFRVKMDAVPGRYTTAWFQAKKVGTYHLFCAEYCGAGHSKMIGHIIVMEPHDYEQWLQGSLPETSIASNGKQLFSDKSCITCHRADTNARAPYLQNAYGKDVKLTNGDVVKFDDGYIRESIMNPQAKVVQGYQPIMPTFKGQLSEDELRELIMYIKSLSDSTATESKAGNGSGE